MTLPLELDLAGRPGAFHKPEEPEWRRFYRVFAEQVIAKRLVRTSNPLVTLTEHPDAAAPERCLCVAVNNSAVPVRPEFEIAHGWMLEKELPELAPFSGAPFRLIKN